MNKVLNINLGGYPFTIDDDAFEHLNQYLDTIHAHFESSEGYDDITSDIEDRMAELFAELKAERPIVTLKIVKSAISIMGTPEDFGAEPVMESNTSYQNYQENKTGIKTGKRLFRNPEDEVVAGVASGIAAYFGIADPLWVRVLFILATISGGFGIPVYLVLWGILPKAETSSDRLSMKGEQINVSNIAKTIETEMDSLSEKLSDLGNEFNSKKKRLVDHQALGEPLRKGFLF